MTAGTIHIRDASIGDAEACCAIYNPYVLGDTCTFEISAISMQTMASRITHKQERWGFLVAEDGSGGIAGFAYYGPFRDRAAYDHVVETSIYLAPGRHRQGLGRQLYSALLSHARKRGFEIAIAVLAVPNPPSQALHLALGFRHQGGLSGVGRKFGQSIDTAYYQREL
ncbi:MAG: N-acetyltransferase family protein [Planctomycetota bacterium]|nr:MAG: N-acetyltransferase family protein [Planctomycetota bacterium]